MAKKKAEEKALRPGVLIAGGIGLVLVLAYAALTFLGGGGGGEADRTASAPSPAASAPSAPSAPKTTPAPSNAPAKEVGLFEGRDPFRPVVSQVQAAAAVAPPSPVLSVAPAPSPSTDVVVEVLGVAEDSSAASVKVGDTTHQMAKPGDKLSSDVSVDKIEGSCVEMHKGDESFRLCVGESATK